MARIRKYRDSDMETLFQLYTSMAKPLPWHHRTRKDQFHRDLFATRYLRRPEDHFPESKIALVATQPSGVVAMVCGGMVTQGDEVINAKTAYISAILGTRQHASVIGKMVTRVVQHLQQFEPSEIVALSACLCPPFFADSASCLPSHWAWIGPILLDRGFEVADRGVRMVCPLDQARKVVLAPDGLEFFDLKHEMFGIDPKFDYGCLLLKDPYQYGDGVVWCGNFYAGAFVKGAGFGSLYINYFTVIDEQYKGKGLGRLVLQNCLRQAQQKGARYASLLTDVDNFTSLNLYRSEGFDVVDTNHQFRFAG